MIGVGEGQTAMTDFKIVPPESSGQIDFTPLPADFGRPVIKSEPLKQAPDMVNLPKDLQQVLRDIQVETAAKDVKPIPEKTEKPRGFWGRLKEKIKNLFLFLNSK